MMTRLRRAAGTAILSGAAALGAALLSAGLVAAPRAAAETLERYTFEVSWSVFPDLVLATGTLALEEDGESYRMAMEARARVPFPSVEWDGYFAAEGRFSETGRRPTLFERRTVSNVRTERAIVAWRDAEAPPETEVEVAPPRVRTVAVDPLDVGPDTIDPLTMMVMMFDRVIETNGASCDVAGRTWDGVRLARIQTTTGDRLRAARVDCRITYLSIDGLSDAEGFDEREATTTRIVRFEKRFGAWRPVWVRIEGEFAGFESTFVTTISPAE